MKLLKISLFVLALIALAAPRAYAVFDSEAQSVALSGALKAYYAVEGEVLLSPVSTLAPVEKAPTSIELVEVPQSLAPSMQIKARYKEGDKTVSELSASFRAQWRVNALVARRALQRGIAFSPADFETQVIDRLSLKQIPVETSIKLADYELTVPLYANVPLTWNLLKPVSLIRKGNLVDVIAQEGLMRVSMRAVATQDAGRGQEVLMRNPSTNKTFNAYVINENTVEIRF